ncbi:MAG: cytochrome ubiquinol oxidase subunit I [Bacteroidales bacterium]
MFDLDVLAWSRLQFAMTAMYHWIFVPLTLGLGFICAIMETIYLKKGKDPEWKRMTKFWMRLFAINFAVGVATGLILEFQFGTNWSNYSYFVGDIFGAPLAIEGMLAFFMEATFFAVMFFGWDKVSDRFHLTSTWLTAIGTVLSAIWILVANAWMQHPVGMEFNIETARNEMVDFWAIALSEVAITKFIHTVASGFITASVFVAGISAWFLLKKREVNFALNSFKIAAIFGIVSSVVIAWTGDSSSIYVAKYQPAKFAAFEGLYKGCEGANLTVMGVLNLKKEVDNQEKAFHAQLDIPNMLSFLAFHDVKAFVPGFNDLVYGNKEQGIMGADEKMERGRVAIEKLRLYHAARKSGDNAQIQQIQTLFDSSTPKGEAFLKDYFAYFGYAYLNSPKDIIPNIPLTFYSFRIMVILGFYFIALFMLAIWFQHKKTLETKRWFLYTMLFSIPLVYIASQAGWVVAEVGRQPWTIQNLLPTVASLSSIDSTSVAVTFFLFASLFAIMLVAELSIMFKQIKIGPKED